MEVWKEVEGTNGDYLVSNLGRVKSVGRIIAKGKMGERFQPERILKESISVRGYARVSVPNGTLVPVHRLVAMHFIPNPHNKREVNHLNGVKADNRVENLEWCTRSENERHARRIGLKTSKRLGAHPQSIISDELRSEIVSLYQAGAKMTELSKRYNLNVTYIFKLTKKMGVYKKPEPTFVGERRKAYYREYQLRWQQAKKDKLKQLFIVQV